MILLTHLDGQIYEGDAYEVTDRNFFLFIVPGVVDHDERKLKYVVPIAQTHHVTVTYD